MHMVFVSNVFVLYCIVLYYIVLYLLVWHRSTDKASINAQQKRGINFRVPEKGGGFRTAPLIFLLLFRLKAQAGQQNYEKTQELPSAE